MSRVLLITDDAMALHDPGPGHPERPERLRAIGEMLEGLRVEGVARATPQAAERAHVERVHDAGYIDQIDSLRGRSARLDADTAVSSASVDAAYLAAGAAIDAVTTVCTPLDSSNQSPNRQIAKSPDRFAFALVRPPGHHAERNRAMGFCLFNNIAVAAAHAIDHLGVRRVLVVDWDVHHGNGTQHIFQSRRDVLFFSSHQWPLYPGTGALEDFGTGEGKGFTVNAPLPAGSGDSMVVEVFRSVLAPIADAYKPDLVLVSAGFDAHREDPLAGLRMTEDGFAALCGIVREIAARHANGRLALMLEGGYNLAALAGSVKACIEVLAGADPPPIPPLEPGADSVINRIRSAHRRFWPIL